MQQRIVLIAILSRRSDYIHIEFGSNSEFCVRTAERTRYGLVIYTLLYHQRARNGTPMVLLFHSEDTT